MGRLVARGVGAVLTPAGEAPAAPAALAFLRDWAQRLRGDEAEVAAADARPRRPGRLALRLWELPHKLLCPVIGTCLPISEVRRLARKHGLIDAGASDYEAHVGVIQHCKTRTPLAQDVQRLLDRRHIAWLGRFERIKEEADALALWRQALARGEAAGALWGVVSARAATEALLQTVYEDIHMFSHQMGAGVRADLQRIQALEGELAALQAQLKRAQARAEAELAARAQRIHFLEGEAARARQLESERQGLRRQLAAWQSGEQLQLLQAALAQQRAQCEALEARVARVDELEAQAAALVGDNRRLLATLQRVQAERDALERLLEAPGAQDCADCERADACGGARLPWRRLLCVGGSTRLHAHYRSLAERLGAELVVHDGGREAAMSRLPELLAQADAVLCPTDCVSHAAYYQVKRHCKQLGKPCVLLRASGLASFAEGLRRLSEGRYDLGPVRVAAQPPAEVNA